ncbi:threonylcarbamoyl-AMP synthase [Candidatus Roizmanbacteria bacterium]|nr:threonylcarbamoyl-AMP synthase [Candidatus Roizmanbacteria bacterium]
MKTIKLKSNNIDQVINNTITVLKSSGLVIFPSDTVYGMLCDATNEQAVKKLIAFKNRPPGKAISVFCNFKLIDQLVKMNKQQQKIIEEILPGPFTVILPSKHKVNKLLESEKGTIGIRVPMYRYIEVLINGFKKPITATSANIAGRPAHYSVKTLLNELSNKQKKLIDLIVDAGVLSRNKPSTVVDLTQSDVKILRQGDVGFPNKSKIFLSKSTEETKDIAIKILKEKLMNKNKPLIFIIEGELGVGKTVFVKGLGESLGIKNIVSPTFVIYYEYGNFYHFDLYRIEEKEEFKHLGIEKLLIPGNILCFEWGEKAGEIIDLLKSKGEIIYVKMKYIDEKERTIQISEVSK